MKKFMAAVLAAALMLSLCGCKFEEINDQNESVSEEKEVKIWDFIPEIPETDAEEFDYEYDSELGGMVVTNYLGQSENVRIPDELDNKPVVKVDFSYLNKELTELVVPDTIKSFSLNDKCIPEYLNIPGSLTEEFDFSDNGKLKGVFIGKGISNIGYKAFRNCKNLETVYIPESVTEIDNSAFDETLWLKNKQKEDPLVIVNNILIDGTTCTGDVVIPDGVTSIAITAFDYCTSLTSVTIPDSVTKIGDGAFELCENLSNVIIGNGVTEIGMLAFNECKSLTSITIPNSVKEISYDAFLNTPWFENKKKENPLVIVNNIVLDGKNCRGSIVIPNGVTTICDKAFEYANLTSISIPSSVTKIGENAFNGTPWLENKQREDPLVVVNNIVVNGQYCTGKVNIPNGITSIAAYAFLENFDITNVTIPNSVTEICEGAFGSCTELKSINIPKNVTEIANGAFFGCESLTSINIPDSVTKIGKSAFYYCENLTNIIIPDSVTSIESEAFGGCDKLKITYKGNTYDCNTIYYAIN